jgi:predicted Zn-dependent protease
MINRSDESVVRQTLEQQIAIAQRLSETGDLEAALLAWSQVRDLAPHLSTGWFKPAELLFRIGDFDAAEILLRDGTNRFPRDHGFFIEYGWAAHRKKAWADAEQRWAEVRNRFPDIQAGYVCGAASYRESGRLDEAARLLHVAVDRFPDDVNAFVEQARLEHRRAKWDQAARLWKNVRVRFSGHPAGYSGGAEACRELGRLSEAESIIAEGQIRFPADRSIAFTWADLAKRSQNWIETARRWRILSQCYPGDLRCIVEAANALNNAGQHDLADTLMSESQAHYPDDIGLAVAWAESADRRRAWALAATRWATLRERFPAEPRGYGRGMRAFLEAGDLVGAENLAAATVTLFPEDANLMVSAAEIAMRSGDLDQAAKRWEAACAADPRNIHAVTRYVETLLRLDRRAVASTVLDRALLAWPDNEALLRWRIEIPLRAKAFPDAVAAWVAAGEVRRGERTFLTEMAIHILLSGPDGEGLEPIFDYLAMDRDSGERNWLPAITRVGGHLAQRENPLRPAVAAYLDRPNGLLDETGRLLWKALIGAPLTDAEIEQAFEHYLANGRMRIVATLFADFNLAAEPTLRLRGQTIFERFVANKLAAPDWIHEENPEELLAYLMFAATSLPQAYKALALAGISRLSFHSIPLDAAPETAASALAQLLRSVSDIVGPAALKSPGLVSRVSRPLKIAICVSGQLRGFERAFPIWNRLGLSDYDTSIFVHTWQDTGRNWGRTWWFLKNYPALWQSVASSEGPAFLRRRFPKLGEAVTNATAAGMDITEPALKAFYQSDDVIVQDDRRAPFAGQPNVWKMHYKIEQTHAMAVKKMPSDTLYIRIRPDQSFGKCDPIDWDHVYFESASNRRLYVDIPYIFTGGIGTLKIGDAFVLGAKEPMAAFADVFSTQAALVAHKSTLYGAPPFLLNHSNVAFSTFYRGVSVEPFHAARPNGFLEATILPPSLVLELLQEDIGEHPKDQLEIDFLAACKSIIQ